MARQGHSISLCLRIKPIMSDTVTIITHDSRQAKEQIFSLKDWVMGLLARMLPDEQLRRATQTEAAYLVAYAGSFERVPPEKILFASEQTRSEQNDLIGLLGKQDRSSLDIVVLILCYLVETDPMMGRCVAYLQQPMGGSRPTLSLLSTMFCESGLNGRDSSAAVMAKIANGKAVKLGLLEILNDSVPFPERSVRLHDAVVLNVTDSGFNWPGASTDIACLSLELPPSIAEKAFHQAESLGNGSGNVLVIRSSSDREKTLAAYHVSRFLNRRALFIEDQDRAMTALGPVCEQKKLLPVLQYDCGPGSQVKLPVIAGYQGPVIVLAGHEGAFEAKHGSVTSWIIPFPTPEERRNLWETHLGNHELAGQLACDHVHGMDRIIEMSSLAKRQSIIGNKENVGIEEIREAAWLRESKGLNSMARPVKANMTDDTLVVRPQTRHQLSLLEQRCRLRELLADNLGITLQARYQMGVKALFTGPSGTGKTLAASWLAYRLGMPLYRVDLASITSKYIGETEKNLSRLLGQAEQEDIVMLFDEADSLFGKRTDVKDSNDRFANAQTNYLLQRIETYSGVVLLTSNSRARFDAAFTRRLDMMIDFPLPSPEERRAIWLNHLGSFHTLTKGNINQLAVQCDLSGGHIRNVVLTAAVIAKHSRRKISIEDVVLALMDEYHKLGKQISQELKKLKTED
jgi:hypothetical protein